MTKSEIKKAYRKLIILLVIGVFILLCVIAVYIYNFHSNKVSSNPADWGSFGDFIGGILNPLISLYSLILLGFISYYIAKDSSNESNELNLRLRRMDAYNELSMHIPALDRFMWITYDAFKILFVKLNTNILKDNTRESVQYVIERLDKPTAEYLEFQLFLSNFKNRYDHLFKYNFENQEYIDAVKIVRELTKNLRELVNNLNGLSESKEVIKETETKILRALDLIQDCINRLEKPLQKFTTCLKDELKV